MKSYKFFVLLIFVFSTAYSQQKLESSAATDSTVVKTDSTISKQQLSKWTIEIGTGISNGTRPYTKGYFTSINNQVFEGFIVNTYLLGGTYKFSDIVGLKMDISFDRFINSKETKSLPFETIQYRTTIQAIFNYNSFVKSTKVNPRCNILLHGGLNLARLIPVKADYNTIISSGDNYGGIVFGITPTVRILQKTTIFVDFSSFKNYGQNLNWNGKHSEASNNTEGHMYSGTFGLSFALDKSTQKTKN